jgi:hypothetical protein
VDNSTFLQGGNQGPNAQSALVTATLLVVLNFIGIGWPHVTVGTLTKQPAAQPPVTPPRQRG